MPKYKVVLQRSAEGYAVSCPGLPGCWSQGATETSALENMKDAIREYVAAIEERVQGWDVREIEVSL